MSEIPSVVSYRLNEAVAILQHYDVRIKIVKTQYESNREKHYIDEYRVIRQKRIDKDIELIVNYF
ncbi:MAG: hypothetical protein ACOYVK_05195 [Bacillota bacterium]